MTTEDVRILVHQLQLRLFFEILLEALVFYQFSGSNQPFFSLHTLALKALDKNLILLVLC